MRSSQQAELVILKQLHCEDIRVAHSSALKSNAPPPQSPSSSPSTTHVLRERTLDSRLHLTAMRLQQSTGAAGVAIALTADGTALVCRAAAGILLEDVGRRISLSYGLAAECLISGRLQWSGNTVSDHRLDDGLCRELGIPSIAVVPVLAGDTLVGILQFLYRQPYAFGARDLIRLEDLAQAVVAQMNASAEDVVGLPVPDLSNSKSRSVRPYESIILIAAFLLFTLIFIRPRYIERYLGPPKRRPNKHRFGGREVKEHVASQIASPTSKVACDH
jgi:hypothetical protein